MLAAQAAAAQPEGDIEVSDLSVDVAGTIESADDEAELDEAAELDDEAEVDEELAADEEDDELEAEDAEA
jgi:hypothetical protein